MTAGARGRLTASGFVAGQTDVDRPPRNFSGTHENAPARLRETSQQDSQQPFQTVAYKKASTDPTSVPADDASDDTGEDEEDGKQTAYSEQPLPVFEQVALHGHLSQSDVTLQDSVVLHDVWVNAVCTVRPLNIFPIAIY